MENDSPSSTNDGPSYSKRTYQLFRKTVYIMGLVATFVGTTVFDHRGDHKIDSEPMGRPNTEIIIVNGSQVDTSSMHLVSGKEYLRFEDWEKKYGKWK